MADGSWADGRRGDALLQRQMRCFMRIMLTILLTAATA